jgi:nucleoside-diphosphate-sugar epimerase
LKTHPKARLAHRLFAHSHKCLSESTPVFLGSGKQVRDFIDVKTAGANICDAALGNRQGAMNICSGVPRSVHDFATAIADEYGRRDLLEFETLKDNPSDWDSIVSEPQQSGLRQNSALRTTPTKFRQTSKYRQN